MKKLCVVGSINMDLVAWAERFPVPGETIIGQQFETFPGGKGANQAVAAGRLQADVCMIGKVGGDSFGEQLLHNLQTNGVKTNGVGVENGLSSGIAVIEVDGSGENHIIVVPGANGKVEMDYIHQQFPAMLACDIFLFQLEIPLETVWETIKRLKNRGKTIILDPAPARMLPEDIYQYIDFITPNETELSILTGVSIETADHLERAAQKLLHHGVQTVIAKAGKNGAYLFRHQERNHIPGFIVEAVDTTAAGDTFNAGFAVSMAQEFDIKECIRFANAAAAISTTAKGAQSAMPTLVQVQSFCGNLTT